MAATPIPYENHQKTVASLIRDAIERNGFKDVKECARGIRVPYDLLNKVVGGHIPKDAQLVEYAKKLKLDHRELLLAAYKEKAPDDMKPYFNSVVLLEDHDPQVREMIEIVDGLTKDQLGELLDVARMVSQSPREICRKGAALLGLYQEMPEDLMMHFESLVLLAMRNESLETLDSFRKAVNNHKPRPSRKRSRA